MILEAMGNHRDHAEVQLYGCWALARVAMTATGENQVQIAEQGGIKVILEAMGNHRGHAWVQQYGCLSLLAIGWWRRDLQEQIKNAGAETLVTSAMSSSNATDSTKEQGRELLDRLARV